jgi:hypothetical protein
MELRGELEALRIGLVGRSACDQPLVPTPPSPASETQTTEAMRSHTRGKFRPLMRAAEIELFDWSGRHENILVASAPALKLEFGTTGAGRLKLREIVLVKTDP